ncbi:MAG TPA: FAD-dependent monooxygenase [Vicinamibacterales bacterium]|nr:FAD-dependent monooxygenase [Vicinamibacterales bacterium]
MLTSKPYDVDVVIVGAGLAGLSLARQLLMADDAVTILQLDKRQQVPPTGQKVGEATVQVSGYYWSKVLDLEEHLLREHYMKYNLRFIWKTAGLDPSRIESYSQSYIRRISNVASYQLNRNKLEAELLRRNLEAADRYEFHNHALELKIDLDRDGGPHRVSYIREGERRSLTARWVVDCAGRAHVLQKQLGLQKSNSIRHGASFLWVDGLLNYEALTDSTPRQIRLNPQRAYTGHLPFWLATNHFLEEGLWFWVIPLQGITSLGLVYDRRVIAPEVVNHPKRLVEWICEHFPAFERDLPRRKILHAASYRDISFDAVQTIDRHRWAMAGEAGRWSDPLYSPGGDVIAIYNTLVCDSILTRDQAELDAKVPLYEELERAVYAAYLPSFQIGYDCLGDQEAHSLKYVWELTIYFAFYVFPFINDLFTDRRFLAAYLRTFTRLGRVNLAVQGLLNRYYHWKKENREPVTSPIFFELFDVPGIAVAEGTFYRVGVSVEEARPILEDQLANAMMLARYLAAHVYAMVLDEPALVWNRSFVSSLDLETLSFDPVRMAADYAPHAGCGERYAWPAGWDPEVAFCFKTPRRVPVVALASSATAVSEGL